MTNRSNAVHCGLYLPMERALNYFFTDLWEIFQLLDFGIANLGRGSGEGIRKPP